MKKDSRFLLGVVLTAVVMIAAVLIGPRIIIALMCNRDEDRKVLDAQTDFFCSDDNKIAYDAWGECGLMKVCTDPDSGREEGSLFAAQGGHMQAKALYSQGKHAGGWTGYDREGNAHPESGGYRAPAKPNQR